MRTAKEFEIIIRREICDTGNVSISTAVEMLTIMKEMERKLTKDVPRLKYFG